MCKLNENSESLPIQSLPALLQDDQAFQLAQQLLRSTSVALRRDADCLLVETGLTSGLHTLVLYLSIHGLSLLCKMAE